MADDKNLQESMRFVRAMEDVIKKFLEMLASYLEEYGRNSAQKEIARYIRNGGELYSYSIQGDKVGGTIEELKNSLDREGIPYVELDNQPERILIRPEDRERIREVNREVLVAKSNYYQEVEASKLERAIYSAPFIKEKNILTIHSLNKYEAEVLKNKCNDISKGFMVGTEKNADGTVNISVHTQHLHHDSNDKRKDFCRAFVETQLSLYGPNNLIKRNQIDLDAEIDKQVASLKGTNVTHYIISAYDKKGYIEINEDRFEFHRRRPGPNGTMQDTIMESCPIDDPDYEMELQRAMDRIYDKVVINDPDLLARHLSTKDKIVQTDRPRRTVKQNATSVAEHMTARQIDRMIKAKFDSDPAISALSPDEYFELYTNEAARILDAAIKDEPCEGYDHARVHAITGIFETYETDIKSYTSVVSQIKSKEHEVHTAKVQDVIKETPKQARNNDERE